MSTNKDTEIYDKVQNAIRVMLNEVSKVDAMYRDELLRAAIALGNIMAPQLHESRLHGENNAVSIAIRSCCEALFWLKLEEGHDEVIEVVEDLRAYLASPRIR